MKRAETPIDPSDHLFQSAAWLNTWRDVWRGSYLPVGSHSMTPSFYENVHKIKGLIQVKNTTPVGQNSTEIPCIRSEYFQFKSADEVNAVFDTVVHQATIGDVPSNSKTSAFIASECEKRGWRLVTRNPSSAYSVDCEMKFADYLATLSSSARAQIFNRRKRLEGLGRLDFHSLSHDHDVFINLLNEFHIKRWGKPCFCGQNERFIRQLLIKLPESGAVPLLSVMTIDNVPISALLDIQVGRRRYNLQAGFEENLAKGLALGVLHLGYAIEESMNSESVDVYDFMAGEGKNTNYKTRFATHEMLLNDFIVVKPLWLQWVYKFYDRYVYERTQVNNVKCASSSS